MPCYNTGMTKTDDIIPFGRIGSGIYLIRKQKVMLDSVLAELYGVPTKAFNQAVTRNIESFPEDFMFQLSSEEWNSLRSQIVTLENSGRGKHRKYAPRVFTEHGILMLSSVLRSERARQVNIAIMRTFVRMREVFVNHEDLARKVQKHDQQIASLYSHVQKLLTPPESKKKPIGFIWPEEDK